MLAQTRLELAREMRIASTGHAKAPTVKRRQPAKVAPGPSDNEARRLAIASFSRAEAGDPDWQRKAWGLAATATRPSPKSAPPQWGSQRESARSSRKPPPSPPPRDYSDVDA